MIAIIVMLIHAVLIWDTFRRVFVKRFSGIYRTLAAWIAYPIALIVFIGDVFWLIGAVVFGGSVGVRTGALDNEFQILILLSIFWPVIFYFLALLLDRLIKNYSQKEDA